MSPVDVPLSKEPVVALPVFTQFTYVGYLAHDAAIAPAGTIAPIFDVVRVLTEPATLTQNPSATFDARIALGPLLDVSVIADKIGTLDVLVAVDNNGTLFSILNAPLSIVANVPVMISGLRIPARFVKVIYTNTDVAAAAVDFGAFIKTN